MIPSDVRQRFYYVIVMPVDVDGRGPAELEYGTTLTYEVWDQLLVSHASYQSLSDAIQDCEQRNAKHYA